MCQMVGKSISFMFRVFSFPSSFLWLERSGVLPVTPLDLPRRFKAIALAFLLQNLDRVGQLIEQSSGEPFGAYDGSPYLEGKIASHHRGPCS